MSPHRPVIQTSFRLLVITILLGVSPVFADPVVQGEEKAQEKKTDEPNQESTGTSADKKSADKKKEQGKSKRKLVVTRGKGTTKSGLGYEILKEGTGPRPGPEDRVKVHYREWLEDGTLLSDTYKRGKPGTGRVSGYIKGWIEGLQLMKVGAKYRLTIPSELGLGKNVYTTTIPAGSTLIYEIELLSIEKEKEK